MGQQKTLEILMVSGACCSPSLATMEKDLEKHLRQAIEQLGLQAEVRVVSLGAVLNGKATVTGEQSQLINALFQKYGARFAPAGLVDTRVLFAGSAPAPEKLKGILEALQPATEFPMPRPVR